MAVLTVGADGLDIAYRRVGDGPPLVFVHGAADDSRIWQPQLAALSDEFTVVAWDEPGAGGSSDVPADFGLAGDADPHRYLRRLEGIAARKRGPLPVAGAREMLAAPATQFDPSVPGLFAGSPPPEHLRPWSRSRGAQPG